MANEIASNTESNLSTTHFYWDQDTLKLDTFDFSRPSIAPLSPIGGIAHSRSSDSNEPSCSTPIGTTASSICSFSQTTPDIPVLPPLCCHSSSQSANDGVETTKPTAGAERAGLAESEVDSYLPRSPQLSPVSPIRFSPSLAFCADGLAGNYDDGEESANQNVQNCGSDELSSPKVSALSFDSGDEQPLVGTSVIIVGSPKKPSEPMKVPSEADTLDLSVEVLEVRTVRKRASSSSHFPVVKPHGVKHERKNRHKHSRSPTAETIRALFAQNSDLIEDIEDSTSASSQSSVSSSSSISSISYDLQLKRAMIAKSKHPTGRSPKSKKNVIMPILAYNPKQKRVNVVLQPATPKGKTTKTTSKVLLGRDPGGNSQTSVCSSRNYGDLALKLTGLHSKDPTFKSNMPQYHRLQLDFHQLTFTGMSFFVDKIPITQTTSPSELQTLINTCGGNVYVHIRDFTALCSERVGVSSANQPKPLFVSDTSRSNCRKFLLAVCCRATLVSHKWIVECTQRRSICPIGQYILPAGIDTFTKTPVIFSCKDDLIPVTPLQNSTAAISGTAEFTKAWSQILKQLGAQVLSPSSSSTKSPDYIVSQSFPSTSPPRHIPALTAQWVIQCALSGLWVDHTTSPALHWELATNQIIATPSQLQSHSQSPKAASAPHSTITKSRSEVLPPTQPHQQRETPHNPTTKRRRVASAL